MTTIPWQLDSPEKTATESTKSKSEIKVGKR